MKNTELNRLLDAKVMISWLNHNNENILKDKKSANRKKKIKRIYDKTMVS